MLFVSHNISLVARLCGRVILLRKGELAFDGVTQETIGRYLSDAVDSATVNLEHWGQAIQWRS